MQPHCEQSGVAPNRQGVSRLFRSAVSESVVRAKMHSAEDCGGLKYQRVTSSGIAGFGYLLAKSDRCASSTARSTPGDDFAAGLKVPIPTLPVVSVVRLGCPPPVKTW